MQCDQSDNLTFLWFFCGKIQIAKLLGMIKDHYFWRCDRRQQKNPINRIKNGKKLNGKKFKYEREIRVQKEIGKRK